MIIEIFMFFLLLSLSLFILGFKYIGELKYGSQLFHIGSAFLLLMCGLIVLAQGVDFKTGSVIDSSNSTSVVVSYTYTTLQGGLESSSGVSILLIMLSLALFLYIFFEFKYIKSKPTNYSEEDD